MTMARGLKLSTKLAIRPTNRFRGSCFRRFFRPSVEKVAEITWVPADKIIKAARIYATSKPAIIHPGVAIEQHVSTTQTIRALLCMIGITGNFDIPGGNVVCDRAVKGTTSHLELHDRLTPDVAKKRLRSDQYKIITPIQFFF